ncbi:uncharacterized protein (N-terminal fragment), partial [Sporisorium reilianum f. sp. reilianum]
MKFQASFVTLLVVVSAAISVADAKTAAVPNKRPSNLNRRDEAAALQKRGAGFGGFAGRFFRRDSDGVYDEGANNDADADTGDISNPQNDGDNGTKKDDYSNEPKNGSKASNGDNGSKSEGYGADDSSDADANAQQRQGGNPTQPQPQDNSQQPGSNTPQQSQENGYKAEGYDNGAEQPQIPQPQDQDQKQKEDDVRQKEQQKEQERQQKDQERQQKEEEKRQKKEQERLKKEAEREKKEQERQQKQQGGQPQDYNGQPQPQDGSANGQPQPQDGSANGQPQPQDGGSQELQPFNSGDAEHPVTPDMVEQSPIPVNDQDGSAPDNCPKFPKQGGGEADTAPCFAKEANRKDICSALKQFGIDTKKVGCSDEECTEDAKDYSNHACNKKKQCDFGWDNSCDFYLHMGFSDVSKFGCGAAGSQQQPQPGTQNGWLIPGSDGSNQQPQPDDNSQQQQPQPGSDFSPAPKQEDGDEDCDKED